MPYIILKPFVNVCPTLKRGGSYAFWEKEREPCAHLGCLRVERRQQGLMEDKKYVEKCLEEKSRMRGDGGQLRGLKCIFWHVSELLRKEKLMKTRPLGTEPQVTLTEHPMETPRAGEFGSFFERAHMEYSGHIADTLHVHFLVLYFHHKMIGKKSKM